MESPEEVEHFIKNQKLIVDNILAMIEHRFPTTDDATEFLWAIKDVLREISKMSPGYDEDDYLSSLEAGLWLPLSLKWAQKRREPDDPAAVQFKKQVIKIAFTALTTRGRSQIEDDDV